MIGWNLLGASQWFDGATSMVSPGGCLPDRPKSKLGEREREREGDLLSIACFQSVFTLPTETSDLTPRNMARVHRSLVRAASETMTNIAADRMVCGASIGISAMPRT